MEQQRTLTWNPAARDRKASRLAIARLLRKEYEALTAAPMPQRLVELVTRLQADDRSETTGSPVSP